MQDIVTIKSVDLQNAEYVNIESPPVPMVKAKGDNLTDNSAVIQAILNLGRTVLIPDGIFLCSGLVTSACKNIIGTGTLKNNANGVLLTTSSDDIRIDHITLEGACNPEWTNEIGIMVDCKYNVSSLNMTFKNFRGRSAYYVTNILKYHRGSILIGCTFCNNNIGFESDIRGEFCNLIGCILYDNTIAISIKGGNVTVSDCEINDNIDGIRLLSGDNDSHGKIFNCNINHNSGYGLYIDSIKYGETILGCHIYSNIYCKNCVDSPVRFIYNILDPTLFKCENCSGIHLIYNHFPNGYLVNTADLNLNHNGKPGNIISEGNTFEDVSFMTLLNVKN
jgi:hypothetical protein